VGEAKEDFMNVAIARMIERYECRRLEDFTRALREILQEIALLGLWRGKFFEQAALYGGTALRILYGLDRFSEDLDFSLLRPRPGFDLSRYLKVLEREIRSFGFDVSVTRKEKVRGGRIQSAFLKGDTLKQLLTIETRHEILRELPRGQSLKIKVEVDTDPPPGFETEVRFLLHPIPFAVRAYTLPDLFAGKMHALVCRRWKSRVKGRDWYDLVWYVSNHPQLRLSHLVERMRQSGDLPGGAQLDQGEFRKFLAQAIQRLDVAQARREVEPFVPDPKALEVWSPEFFQEIVSRIEVL
jgi:predicted nucleotidyltransferase component of viral defense system